jgi:hypothetical protein
VRNSQSALLLILVAQDGVLFTRLCAYRPGLVMPGVARPPSVPGGEDEAALGLGVVPELPFFLVSLAWLHKGNQVSYGCKRNIFPFTWTVECSICMAAMQEK